MKRSFRLLSIAAALTMLIALAAPATAATDWYVDTTGNDANTCTTPGPLGACQTIQAAINKAAPNDTIHVAAGLYPELAGGPLTINKTLTVLGAQAGMDARTRIGAESIISDSQGTYITASNVILDGFTNENSTNNAFTGYGIVMSPGTTGTQILNNIVQNNIIGIGLANSGGSQVVIRHNLIQNNNQPGSSTGTGIYTDEFVCGNPCSNFLVDENELRGNADAGIFISNTDVAHPLTNLDVSENLFDNNGRAVGLINTDLSTIHDNTISNNTMLLSAAIRIFDNVNGLTILRNDLTNGVGHAVRLTVTFGLGPSSGVMINQNNIGVVGPLNFALDGLNVQAGSHVGTVNAECNWWGSSTGPMNASNPGGTGEAVSGDADFTPWLVAPAPGGPCIGGVPSTPGKVTGGGQVEGQDPLFSPLGELLSVPAIILTANGARANFGFAIQLAPGATTPKGNLVYQDHDADVSIKATSYDRLIISDGLCGPDTHALFTGEARVNGVTETLTVEVDDCGEPSSGPPPDMFDIETESYSNGGPLIGGNIQIH